MGAAKGICLADAPAQGVVAVVGGLGDAVAADLGAGQLVGRVPAQVGVAVLQTALVVLDTVRQVAIRVAPLKSNSKDRFQ